MTRRYESYMFCPCCGARYGSGDFRPADVAFHCNACRFVFYQNAAPSATALVPSRRHPDQILMVTRTNPPIGKLALPGGFLGYAEDPAAAARREVREETLVDVTIDGLLTAYPVNYIYQGRSMSVVELVYLTRPADPQPEGASTGEASRIAFYDAAGLLGMEAEIAFPEQLRAVRTYIERRKENPRAV